MRKKTLFALSAALAFAGVAAWTSRGDAGGWAYFPYGYGDDQSVSLVLAQSVPGVAPDFSVAKFAVVPKVVDGRSSLPAFYIHDAAFQADEAGFSGAQFDVRYTFFWTDSAGRARRSDVSGKEIQTSGGGWADAAPAVRLHAELAAGGSGSASGLDDLAPGAEVSVLVGFADDFATSDSLDYAGVAKEFAFRVSAAWAQDIGVAKDGSAAFHVQPGQPDKVVAFRTGTLGPRSLYFAASGGQDVVAQVVQEGNPDAPTIALTGSASLTPNDLPMPASATNGDVYVRLRGLSVPGAGRYFSLFSDQALYAADPAEPVAPAPAPAPAESPASGTLSGTTSVEVTMPGAEAVESYDDDGKDTAPGALHAYRTRLCNNSAERATGVAVRISVPAQTSFLGTSGDLAGSSLTVDGTVIDPSAAAAPIALDDVLPGACREVKYAVEVDESVASGAVFRVANAFLFGTGAAWQDTNEVINQVVVIMSGGLDLAATPASGTKVERGDYVDYSVTFRNDGTAAIPSGKVTCSRMASDALSECMVGQCSPADFENLEPGGEYQFGFSVRVAPGAAQDALLANACHADFADLTADSVAVAHAVDVPLAQAFGGAFELELYARPKLIASPDGNPRPDGLDASPIQYTYRYAGSRMDNAYPKLSQAGQGSYGGNPRCGPTTIPYQPGAYTYWANSASTSPRSDPNVGSSPLAFSFTTVLPSAIPKTLLKSGTLTPSHQVSGGELNGWFVSGGERVLPVESTVHRATVNGRDGEISSAVSASMRLDKWQYVTYAMNYCRYVVSCGKKGCRYNTRPYQVYRWQLVSSQQVPFNASAKRAVDVTGSTGWLRTRNGDVHTNNRFSQEGTSANVYDLGEDGFGAVKSSPKSYTPPGSFHADGLVSSDAAGNLSSKAGWYAVRKLPFGHGDAYDRSANPRDYYGDLLDRQKFGKVVRGGQNPLKSFDPALNEIWYWPGDLTIESPTGTFLIGGKKATIVVGGNLRIKSDMAYAQPSGAAAVKDLPYLGLVVRGDVTIDPGVTATVGAWHIEGTLRTGVSAKRWKHLGQVAAGNVDLQRKAPEFNDGETNAPSEDVVFDDQLYATIPPGFAQLDDGRWSFSTSVNQFSGETSNGWDAQ